MTAAAGISLTTLALVVRSLFKVSERLDQVRLQAVLQRIVPGQEETVLSIAAQEIIAEVRPRFLAEGKAEGKAEGRREGRADVLRRQLQRRFGDLPAEVAARLAVADSDQLDLWLDRVLDRASLEQVFQEP